MRSVEHEAGPPPRPAPAATLAPERTVDELGGELVDLLCDDPEWLDAAFAEIVETSWGGPPSRRGGKVFSGPGRPRQRGVARTWRSVTRDGKCRHVPTSRERSPPGSERVLVTSRR